MDKLEYDRLGFRLKLGVIVPSTNTCVQPEFDDMRPRGVTNHVARIMLKDAQQTNDQQQAQVMDDIQEDFLGAIDRVMTCDPDAIVLGMSLPTFWGGVPACDRLKARIEAHAGIPVFMGSQACIAALKKFPDVKRLGVITPYQPIGDCHVTTFFRESGYEVSEICSLLPKSLVGIAFSGDRDFLQFLTSLAAKPIDAIVQVGTNLAMADIADEAERWLGIPVLAINTATYWHALRQNGIDDKVYGYGSLLAQF